MGERIFLLVIHLDRVETFPSTSCAWQGDLFKRLHPLFPKEGMIAGAFLQDRGWLFIPCPHLELSEEVEILLENIPFCLE